MSEHHVYPVNGAWVIADGAGWLPGSYASEGVAQMAFCFTEAELHAAQDRANERGGDRTIRLADLEAIAIAATEDE